MFTLQVLVSWPGTGGRNEVSLNIRPESGIQVSTPAELMAARNCYSCLEKKIPNDIELGRISSYHLKWLTFVYIG